MRQILVLKKELNLKLDQQDLENKIKYLLDICDEKSSKYKIHFFSAKVISVLSPVAAAEYLKKKGVMSKEFAKILKTKKRII